MNVECGFVVDCINGLRPNEKRWDEQIQKHMSICWECRELVELLGELPYVVNTKTFSAGMKERILAIVFEEKPGSYAIMSF